MSGIHATVVGIRDALIECGTASGRELADRLDTTVGEIIIAATQTGRGRNTLSLYRRPGDDVIRYRLTVPACTNCRADCQWADDAWRCTGCGDEWASDHGDQYAPPGDSEVTEVKVAPRGLMDGKHYVERRWGSGLNESRGWFLVTGHEWQPNSRRWLIRIQRPDSLRNNLADRFYLQSRASIVVRTGWESTR